jgi:O-6-methylguanine DNA methyltransferase
VSTQLQEKVWEALTLIPRGRVTTYGEIARYLQTKAVRAVGTAVGKNPNAPEVPCHRVVPSNGKIGNYSGGEGTLTKISLLEGEGVEIKGGKVSNFANSFWSFDSLN